MSATVVCVQCDAEIYECSAVGKDYAGERVDADDFIPLGEYAAPKQKEEMLCPVCNKPFVYPIGAGQCVLKLTNNLWWPHPPIQIAG